MPKDYKYKGEDFKLDDSKGCYLEVRYKDQVGYMGVNLSGRGGGPYAFTFHGGSVSKDGITQGGSVAGGVDANLSVLCKNLLEHHRQAEARAALKPEEACREIHKFFDTLT